MKETNGKVKPFGIKDKLGYMFGDFGNDFTFLLSAMFLLKFYTDVMGVSAALVGLMMMALDKTYVWSGCCSFISDVCNIF